ncbi:MAG TPA: tetratricopeptide repeat protein [Opitutaceae bacterium]|nr:tetratricopeptide repeat protein [Opitutaceae bacterium]
MGGAASARRDWRPALILPAALLAYLPALRGGFIWDDDGHVTRPDLRSLGGLRRIWAEPGATQQYYPVLHSAFWLEHRLWGDAPLGYHLLNVLLHAAAAALFVRVLRQLAAPGALLAGFLFALHPVCVESVAWISEQKNTLSAVFYLLAALAYLRFDRTRRPGAYAAALGLFLLAVLSKTVTATLPAALLVVFWWKRGRLSWRRDALPLLPWFALAALGGGVTAWVERRYIGAQGADFSLSLAQRVLVAGRVVWFYLGKLLWPSRLAFIYPRWNVSPAAAWQWLFPLSLLALLAWLWTLRRRNRAPLAAALLFVGTLFPALGFINVYPFVFSFVADHFQYLASLGLIALAAAGISAWRDAGGRATASAALACALGALSFRQARMYGDQERLYRATIARNPECWMAYNNLGNTLVAAGRAAEAVPEYEEALRLRPGYAEADFDLGFALLATGRPLEAIRPLEAAARLRPGEAGAQFALGNALSQAGDLPQAEDHFRRALELRPSYPEAEFNLGLAVIRQGRPAEARACWEAALRMDPNFAPAREALALLRNAPRP